DLERAIELGEAALAATPEDHPDRPGRLVSLAGGLRALHLVTGKKNHLERAIDLMDSVLARTPTDAPEYFSYQATLGSFLSNRHDCLGDFSDLERAIELKEAALAATPEDHPVYVELQALVATDLPDRFLERGDIADIKRAAELWDNVVDRLSIGDSIRSYRYSQASICFRHWYRSGGPPDALRRAYELALHAVALDPGGTTLSPSIRRSYFAAADALRRSPLGIEISPGLHLRVAERLLVDQPEVAFGLAEDVAEHTELGSGEHADALCCMIAARAELLRLAPRIEETEAWAAEGRGLGPRAVTALQAAGQPASDIAEVLERCQTGLLAQLLDANRATLTRLKGSTDTRSFAGRYENAVYDLKRLRDHQRDPEKDAPPCKETSRSENGGCSGNRRDPRLIRMQ
ncbi:MAG: hypothetical protein AAF416_23110, partial [Pseudomonadota bacterium]